MLSRLITRLLLGLVIVLVVANLALNRTASASTIIPRSVTISSAIPSAVVSNDFKFSLPTTSNIGSIVLQYCSNSPSFYFSCTAPTGLDVSAANLTTQSGNVGFSIDNADTNANQIVLTRTVAPGVTSPSEYVFNNITNPSTPGQSVFVKISTHLSQDGSGPTIDTGAVAFAILSVFNVGAYVPPFLKLCVGLIVAPDCSSFSGDSIDLGILSSTTANAGQSQFATATNDPNGYVVYAVGTTMTSGNDVIPSLAAPTVSFPGTAQFGINLRANLIPAVGQDPIGLGTGVPEPNYNIPNQFTYNNGDAIASSPLTTNYNRMTVSYVVNVPKNQPPGIYSTTITYVATVQF